MPRKYMSASRFYVYTLTSPDGRIFYIGKGSRARPFDHAEEARAGHQSYKCNYIRKLWSEGQDYAITLVFETDDESAAFAEEQRLIALAPLGTLTNRTLGGEGMSGFSRPNSDETRRKMSESHLGRPWTTAQREGHKAYDAFLKGKPICPPGPRSEEHRRHLSEALKGRGSGPPKGTRFTDEHKKKIADGLRGKPFTEERKRNISEALRARSAALAAAGITQTVSVEARRKISEAKRGRPFTDEHKRHISEGRRRWLASRS